MEITFDRKTVNTCLQQRFALPTYQREFRWEAKHLQDLLTDIQEEFLLNYDPAHGRSKVAEYAPYFLGTIITTNGPDGTRLIVDGQQRLTTLSIILVFFHRAAKNNTDLGVSDVEPLLRRKVFGDSAFNLEFDADRKALFEILIDKPDVSGQALDELVDSIPDLSHSTRDLYALFTLIDALVLEEIINGLVARFVDYIIERVYLFEIGVPSEQDGHKVFVTMNDRGLRLAPLDLLKGYLLSNISDAKANATANQKWAECIRELRSLGRDEDSTFFKTWLRAQYAVSTRGKSRGDAAGDFEIVGDAYHRWVVDNAATLGLNNSDDFYDLVERQIPFYVAQYKRLRIAEDKFSSDFPHVFYNGAKGIALQYMTILSALEVSDTSAIVDKKIRIVSFFIDAYISSRVLVGRDNNYDNIKDPLYNMTKLIRRQSVTAIADILKSSMNEIEGSVNEMGSLSYWRMKRQDGLHLLSRLACHLEEKLDLTNKVGFPDYIDRTKGNKTFDIEHIVPASLDILLGIAPDGTELRTTHVTFSWRDAVGALILLPRGRNRSMKDMSYPDKLTRYATENVLALTLHDSFYLNHPQVAAYIAATGLPLQAEACFGEDAWTRRTVLYQWLARDIWSRSKIDELIA